MAAAYVARKMGIPATIMVPSSSPQTVVQRLKDEGAAVKIVGKVKHNIKYTCVTNLPLAQMPVQIHIFHFGKFFFLGLG